MFRRVGRNPCSAVGGLHMFPNLVSLGFHRLTCRLPLLLKEIAFSGSIYVTKVAQSTQKSMDSAKSHLVWIDLEMTGLDHNSDHILEVGCLVTNSNLDIIGEGIELIIHHPDEVLNNMNDWCKVHHKQSGLWEKCRKSTVSLEEAEDKLLAFLEKQTPKNACPIAGNSVYMDRLFLMKYMPRVNSHMHYRIVDVSTVKELCRRWSPLTYSNAPEKTFKHRSIDDLYESISELRYYREKFLK